MSKQPANKRRSKRLALSIPIRIYGRTPDNRPFRAVTETSAISLHGGLFRLKVRVKPGQTVLLVHGITQEERECRVAFVKSSQQGKKKVGVEFKNPKGDFWHVYPVGLV
jgi:hypothetical protein